MRTNTDRHDEDKYDLCGLRVTVQEAYELLENYSDEDVRKLLFNGGICLGLYLKLRTYFFKRLNNGRI
jgi:hypothetical protein